MSNKFSTKSIFSYTSTDIDVNLQNRRGFTLVEMMVAVSIFVIVALVISGTYITLADVFRKVQSNRAVIDNLNFAMDTMTLQIREGRTYNFENNCGGNCFEKINFKELVIIDGEQVPSRNITYELGGVDNTEIIQCTTPLGEIEEDCAPLTSPEIEVKSLNFYRKNSVPERIVINIYGIAKNKEGLKSEFTLQTTLAQRNF